MSGKEKNKHKSKKGEEPKSRVGRAYTTKTPVPGIIERNSNVYTKKVFATDHEFMLPIINGVNNDRQLASLSSLNGALSEFTTRSATST